MITSEDSTASSSLWKVLLLYSFFWKYHTWHNPWIVCSSVFSFFFFMETSCPETVNEPQKVWLCMEISSFAMSIFFFSGKALHLRKSCNSFALTPTLLLLHYELTRFAFFRRFDIFFFFLTVENRLLASAKQRLESYIILISFFFFFLSTGIASKISPLWHTAWRN